MQAKDVTESDVIQKPEYEQKRGADYLDSLTPSAAEDFRIPTLVPASNRPLVVSKPVPTGSPIELGMGNTVVQADGTEFLEHYRPSSHLSRRRSPPSRTLRNRSSPYPRLAPDPGTPAQPPSEKRKKAKERKIEYTGRKKEALRRIRKFLKCEGMTEEGTFLKGEIWVLSFTPCFRSTNYSFCQCLRS